ncbi:MAG TPA: hypothetical protein VN600_04290 [Gemmatimonadaceae bacterium]|nr:hypothetical protein [Gemmatimonadaceae bacterium]
MSGNDEEGRRAYASVIVVGGGCYGGYYVRQLDRAVAAGALEIERVLVVDHDSDCAVARALASPEAPRHAPVELRIAEWSEFFDEYLSDAAERPAAHADDAIVPSPLMPHLMAEWLIARARARAAGRSVAVEPFDTLPDVPWERAGHDATHYVSFATWTCPINCVEPRICPHTRGPRSWSMPVALRDYAKREASGSHDVEVAVLHCRHRSYGVGMFDTREVLDADERIAAAAERGPAEAVVGTVSHCHGALTRVLIGGLRAEAGSRDR